MKMTKLMATTAVLASTLVLGNVVASAEAGKLPATYETDTTVKFSPSDEITPPVDPLDPENPTTPVDPEDPDKPIKPGTNGPLSIDFASPLYFGENKIVSSDKDYFAEAQPLSDGTTRPNYVQITDNRGGEQGWTLQVKQNGQFISKTSKRELTGAQISFANGQVATATDSKVPSLIATEFTLVADGTGAAQNVMTAKAGEGAGTHVYRSGDDAAKATSIKLSVPGKLTKLAETYATTLTYTLTDVPGNDTPE
ncbi:WxL domain-containing protein [Carnobacterium divergens]|uniref:WxL domain surface protein n=1 Tax=Carnobacterium divergens DSM 20623 TaxID=1449336 RepID=A0A0R2I2W3_CARDV|nr:WxL domain-containing protein [Carnobacterium divergens]AOA00632.1 cell surface protein [Carnobacterium divergens]KRN57894.1 WxL domain surface protein [Carnobacterium divergens DSM 20623]MDO0874526.1 WxL domain-containing protein [Carnobacterium divergens]MDT1996699.1 WxL domain-containing protein [Carnobacterium divergens]TFI65929.1 WxL domain-containing protein [Carnobacterium divergens]